MPSDQALSAEASLARVADYALSPDIIVHDIADVDGGQKIVYEIDVPSDGNCFYYAVILACLFPVTDNPDLFRERFERLFGEGEQLNTAENLRELLTDYDGSVAFITRHETELRLLATPLRANLARFMRARDDFSITPFLEDDIDENEYYDRMTTTNKWAGEPETAHLPLLLKTRLIVYKADSQFDESGEVRWSVAPFMTYGDGGGEPIRLVHIDNNHYHILMEPEAFKYNLRESAVERINAVLPIEPEASLQEKDVERADDLPRKNFFARHRGALFAVAGALLVAGIVTLGLFTGGVVPAIAAGIATLLAVTTPVATGIGVSAILLASLGVGALLGAATAKAVTLYEQFKPMPRRAPQLPSGGSQSRILRRSESRSGASSSSFLLPTTQPPSRGKSKLWQRRKPESPPDTGERPAETKAPSPNGKKQR